MTADAADPPAVKTLTAMVDDALDHYLPSASELAAELLAAMRYSTLGNGKRLRPLLTLAAATGCGAELTDALAPACALEFVHAYSLIHDDLPAMDDDHLRHGLPSCHIRFGEANAILAGDALQALAFETLSQAQGLSAEVRLDCVRLLAQGAGAAGMVAGQCRDMAVVGRAIDIDELQALHAAKTGALIRAAVLIGARIGDASAEQTVLLTEFADRVGIAFQIMDDVLDVTSSTETLGKPAGSDALADKTTYPALIGLTRSRERAEELLAEALPLLERARMGNGLLAELAAMAVRRER